VLDASHHAVRARVRGETQPLLVRWTARDRDAWDAALRDTTRGATVASVVRRELPARLADALVDEARVHATRPLAELRRDERARLVDALASYRLPWTGDEGYKKAEVTGGGVALEEIDPKTMQSRLRPGLYLCGEILDAFGPIGGHNFMWAWSTGRQAGLGVLL
jgi:predicted flavoprotein YhiN